MNDSLPCECELEVSFGVLRFGRLFGLTFKTPSAILLGFGVFAPQGNRSADGDFPMGWPARREDDFFDTRFVGFFNIQGQSAEGGAALGKCEV
jgi:hypothetical protein